MTDSRSPDSRSNSRLPGDPDRKTLLERMIRVDQAGEFGATRIYAGQIAVLGKGPHKDTLDHMYEQEKVHLAYFDEQVAKRGVRPTALRPFWHVVGFALGAGSALLSDKAAMAVTVAVEETIDEHYAEQRDILGEDEAELRDQIEIFRLEELEHRDIGLEQGAQKAAGYGLIYQAVRRGSKLAIWLSQRI